MRDIIWTIIIVWLIYRIVEMFKSARPKTYAYNQTRQDNMRYDGRHQQPKRDMKTAVNRSVDKEGDYVDFEEVK